MNRILQWVFCLFVCLLLIIYIEYIKHFARQTANHRCCSALHQDTHPSTSRSRLFLTSLLSSLYVVFACRSSSRQIFHTSFIFHADIWYWSSSIFYSRGCGHEYEGSTWRVRCGTLKIRLLFIGRNIARVGTDRPVPSVSRLQLHQRYKRLVFKHLDRGVQTDWNNEQSFQIFAIKHLRKRLGPFDHSRQTEQFKEEVLLFSVAT